MDYPRHLISHTVTTGDIATVLDAGIRPDWIADPEARRVWKYVVSYHSRYAKAPTAQVLKAEYPTFSLVDPEPVAYVVDKMRKLRASALLETALDEAVAVFESGDTDAVLARLSKAVADVQGEIPVTTDVDITQTGKQRMERYREAGKRDGSLVGITTGFEALNKATGGFRPGQLFYLVGPPKAGKSTVLLRMAQAAHETYKSPLLISFEMANVEQEERYDGLRAGVAPNDLRDGKLTQHGLAKVERATRQMELMVPFWLSADSSSTLTVSGIIAKFQQLKPDIVYVDGIYMMMDEFGEKPGSPQALTNISRALKRAAQACDIPIVATSQVLVSKMYGGEVTLNSVGYSSALGQDGDGVIAVEPTREHDIQKLKGLVGRVFAPFHFFVRRNWKGGEITELTYDPFGEDDEFEDSGADDRF